MTSHASYVTSVNISTKKGTQKTPVEGACNLVAGFGCEGDAIEVVRLGDGTCVHSPQEALDEVESARRTGTL